MTAIQKSMPALRFKDSQGSDYPDWEEKTLGEISDVKRGASPRPISSPKWFSQNSKIGWVRISDVTNSSKYLKKTEQYLSNEGIKKSRFIPKGNIIMSICATIGKPIYTGFDVCIHDGFVVFEGLKVDEEFIYYFLEKTQRRWYRYGQPGTQVNLNSSIVSNEKIKIPKESEQQKIADFLSSVDAKIDQLTKKKVLLEQYKKGMMQKLFSQQIRFKDEKGRDYPDWEDKKLKQIAKIYRGAGLPKSAIQLNGRFPCVLYGELFTKYTETIQTVLSFTDHETTVTSQYGDILMPTSSELAHGLTAASALLIEGVRLGSDMNIIRLTDGIHPIFMSYLINFCKRPIMRLVTGITIKHVYAKDVYHITFSIPASQAEQQKIADSLSAIGKKIELVTEQLIQTQAFKKGLLQQMFI